MSMIKGYVSDAGRLHPIEDALAARDELVWIDVESPTAEEEAEVERLVGVDIPTREEMEEIEASSRLYNEEGTAYMTATLPAHTDSDEPVLAPVSFVLTPKILITVRYHEPRAFKTFPQQAAKLGLGCETAEGVMLALLEATVDRLADVLERAGREIDAISRGIFQHESGQAPRSKDLQTVLAAIGRKGDLSSKIRDSLVTLERLIGFFSHGTLQRQSSRDVRDRIKTLARDLRSLADHASFLASKITFLLDATLGLINIEQNAIIKIFSVAAVAFLPPTLIASIYGMNFEHMPELGWPFGYPLALLVMLMSAILPYLFFKRRGWL
jgi:magnesium transporter